MIRMAFAVACGGVIGTLLRFALAIWVSNQWPRHFYLATLAVNLLGCLLIGYLYATFLARPDISPELRGALIIGFLGALTTFSSFSLDALRLLESGQLTTAFAYVGGSVFGGLLAAWAGLALARL
ncbi:fluoride efflux transporter CrcB [Stutzerimonas kunmingensis]|jgi:CrcB protein|uniref:fluoride efflux transporter CrcB n=1 Tax=Stutzerimonas kunmingensis TaxID=1211807 RepID=UPI000C523ABB|nr:fluoride efflux transporter CrcB [Stutzerimonas kunmingensis]MAK86800.1 fluoride efflux transporter CrcB [Pseudomonas sp.]